MARPLSLLTGGRTRPATEDGALQRLSPIASLTIVAAAAAIAVVAALQEEGGRPTVREARAEIDPDRPHDLRIYLTLVNDGGDDRVTGFSTPLAEAVALAGAAPDGAGDGISLPAGSMLVLDPGTRFVVARDVALDRLPAAGLPLVVDFAHADAVYVAVPVDGVTPAAGTGQQP
jgi:copper(I)-binding protein